MSGSKIFYIILHWTWCLPQTIIGLALYLYLRKTEKPVKFQYRTGTLMVRTRALGGGLSLGFFIFSYAYPGGTENGIKQERMDLHEWGHTLQGFLLGPLYLFIIGLPSAVWFHTYRKTGRQYSWLYTEKWADRWGKSIKPT
ncbi:MAG: hypothetical protein ACLFSE_08180 [Spirochaetia bacterium]